MSMIVVPSAYLQYSIAVAAGFIRHVPGKGGE